MRTLAAVLATLATTTTLACSHPRAGLYMNPADCSMPHYLPLPSYEPLPMPRLASRDSYYNQLLLDREQSRLHGYNARQHNHINSLQYKPLHWNNQ